MFLKYCVTLVINIIIGVIILFSNSNAITFINIIDSIFYVTAIIMVIFLYLFIARGRFFDGITYGMRGFLRKYKKSSDESNHDKPLPSETVSDDTYRLFKHQFLTFLVVLVFLLIIYFL